jgi:hypothetical protein
VSWPGLDSSSNFAQWLSLQASGHTRAHRAAVYRLRCSPQPPLLPVIGQSRTPWFNCSEGPGVVSFPMEVTMDRAWRLSVLVGSLTLLGFGLACGSGDESGGGTSGGGPVSLAGSGGSGASASGDSSVLGDGQNGGAGGLTADSACASSASAGQRLPMYMILLLDRSCSMEEYDNNQQHLDLNNPNARWNQVTGALTTFFASADSQGVIASLILFPTGSQNARCTPNPYTTPSTHDVALPDSTTLVNAMRANDPRTSDCTCTPTSFALQGTLTYATGLKQQVGDSAKVVIVLATDGYPQNCNSVQNGDVGPACTVATSAAAALIPVYVIGVGDQLTNLNQLAAAGGTSTAFLVSTADPTAVGATLLTALNTIRGSILSCEYAMPTPPSGKELDTTLVNVDYTPTGGAETTLPQDQDCKGEGWRYDNPNAPTKIEMCPATCDSIKADPTGNLVVLLGCQTVTTGPK